MFLHFLVEKDVDVPITILLVLPEASIPKGDVMQATEVFGPDTPYYNSRTILTYVKFIKEHHNHVDVSQVLSHAGMYEFQVQDENHWFTQEQVNRFHGKLIECTGDNDISRKAGRYTASAECLGPVKSYAASLRGKNAEREDERRGVGESIRDFHCP